jgi:uncharacterized membrane protein (DUF485 family)
MKSTLQRLEEIKINGYQLDLGEAINEIFENYKKVALLSGAVILLVGIAAMVIFGGFTAAFLGLAAVTETFTDMSEGTPLTSTVLLLNFVLTVIGYGLFAPIAAGLIQLVHNASINEDFDFGTAFMHYKTAYFKDLFLSSAIVTIVGSGLSTTIQILSLSNPEGLLYIG